MPDTYDHITLMCRLKAAQRRNKELESGERYIQLEELYQKEYNVYEHKIEKLKKELADAHKETIRVRNYWFQVLEDMLREFEKAQKRSAQELRKMEIRALNAEKQREDALDKAAVFRHQFYEAASRLEEEQGKNLKLRAQINRDYENSSIPSSKAVRRANIGFTLLTDKEFDLPMGASTGAGVIFGTTGGVMEAVLRSVYEIYTGRTLDNVNFEQVRGLAGVRRATIDLDGFELKVGIAHGLGNARHLLEDIRNGHNEYHVIEIMACPGGCIGGGGQPLHHGNSDVLYARANALYREDANKPLRKSHENPYIKTLYEEYLGKPLSETAEHLLHTHYFNKSMD